MAVSLGKTEQFIVWIQEWRFKYSDLSNCSGSVASADIKEKLFYRMNLYDKVTGNFCLCIAEIMNNSKYKTNEFLRATYVRHPFQKRD